MKFDIQLEYELVGGSGCQWPIPKQLGQISTCLSGGVGRDLGLEIHLADKFNSRVFAFDPTPISIDWVSKIELHKNITFLPFGLYGNTTDLKVSPPKVAGHVSFGIATDNTDSSLSIPCLSPLDAADACKCKSFDVVKIDIEGSEYSFLDSLFSCIQKERIAKPKLILVEFHHGMYGTTAKDTFSSHKLLKKNGYHRYYKSRDGRDQAFIHSASISRASLGVFYVAFGEKYYKEAMQSARSVRENSPNTETYIVTDYPDVHLAEEFDFFYSPTRMELLETKRIIADQNRWPSVKIMFLDKTIFRDTLFLDSDTYVRSPLVDIANELDSFDLLLTNMPKIDIDYRDKGLERPQHIGIQALTGPAFSCAVFAYRMSTRMRIFLDLWKYRFIESSLSSRHNGKGNWGHTGGVNEQSLLHTILSEGAIQKCALRRGTLDNCKYNCGLSMWKTLYDKAMWKDVVIIHSHAINKCISRNAPVDEWPLIGRESQPA